MMPAVGKILISLQKNGIYYKVDVVRGHLGVVGGVQVTEER